MKLPSEYGNFSLEALASYEAELRTIYRSMRQRPEETALEYASRFTEVEAMLKDIKKVTEDQLMVIEAEQKRKQAAANLKYGGIALFCFLLLSLLMFWLSRS